MAFSLEFEEYSFLAEDGGQFQCTGSSLQGLARYLNVNYDCNSIDEIPPYLVLNCRNEVPPVHERPFMIGGLVAVWIVEDEEPRPEGVIFRNRGLGEELFLEDELLHDLEPFSVPKASTLSAIKHQYFPDSMAISYISRGLVVEFELTSPEQYRERLKSLPSEIGDSDISLRYHNGPLRGQSQQNQNRQQISGLDDGETKNENRNEDNSSKSPTKPFQSSDTPPNYVNEIFYMASFVTGPLFLALQGRRIYDENRVPREQLIFATNDQKIFSKSRIRAAVCGAPVVRAQMEENLLVPVMPAPMTVDRSTGREMPSSIVPKNGKIGVPTREIVGYMQWGDIESEYEHGTLLCFADTVDLEDAGRKVVQTDC